MNVLAFARRWLAPDPRSRREVDDDIADELAFHVDMATEDLLASSSTREEARERALAKFGDLERIRAACRREQLGGRIMLLRIQWVVIGVLLCALIVLGMRSVAAERMAQAQAAAMEAQLRAAQAEKANGIGLLAEDRDAMLELSKAALARAVAASKASDAGDTGIVWTGGEQIAYSATTPSDPQVWLARFAQAPNDWRKGLDLAYELAAKLEPRAAFEVMQVVYPQLSLEVRQQVFKPFVLDGGHPFALQMLQLGVADAAPSVRERAFSYLKDYAFVDFSEDPAQCDAWFTKYGALPLDRAIAASATDMVTRLRNGFGDALAKDMRLLSDANFAAAKKAGVDVDATLRDAGLPALVRQWTASNDADQIVFGLRAAGWLNLSETDLRGQLDALEHNAASREPAVWDECCRLIGRPGNAWAVTPLVEHMHEQMSAGARGEALVHQAIALAQIGDANAVPHLIALMRTDDSTDQRYALGYFGLRELTGVAYDESHSAQWWVDWWSANSARFPNVANPTLPDYGH